MYYALGHNQCVHMMYVCMAGAQMYEGVGFIYVWVHDMCSRTVEWEYV